MARIVSPRGRDEQGAGIPMITLESNDGTPMKPFQFLLFVLAASLGLAQGGGSCAPNVTELPADIQEIVQKPMYRGAVWGLRVIDAGTGKVLIDVAPHCQFFIGSVRKVFSVGALLNEVGPTHRYNTPVYRNGEVDQAGVLHGDLILVASGDLTMGGRTNPDGSIAFTNFDHNEADALGNATLTSPNPLAGYAELARQVSASGIKRITGNVVVDDRLFQPFNFRGQFDVRPIFVNDDVVDLTISPVAAGNRARVSWRPVSAALDIKSTLLQSAAGTPKTLEVDPIVPACIGQAGCSAAIQGDLPANFVPPLTNAFPLVQTVRITQPSNYARTVFIEALQSAGVEISVAPTGANPVQLLPAKGAYQAGQKTAELIGMPYSEDAKFVLKVSYNIGAETSLVLLGLTRGVDNMQAALALERKNLATNYGIPNDEFHFIDGSGGGDTTATNQAVTQMLFDLKQKPTFPVFYDALPILAVDGSLGFVTDFKSDTKLAGAAGQVHAKTGTFVQGTEKSIVLKGQALGGYVTTKSGRRLVFELVVNNVDITASFLAGVMSVFQDQGRIAAILWRDN
jgi:D-alanyl-D-alanine carboxypeptidase